MYANEACAMLFKRNRIHVKDNSLHLLLDDGISHVYQWLASFFEVVPRGRFDVKPWLRHIVLRVDMEQSPENLVEQAKLLVECFSLRKVEVILSGGVKVLKSKLSPSRMGSGRCKQSSAIV